MAKAIIFLCSEEASSITGHVLKVDGGKSLTTSGGFTPWYGMDNMDRRFEASGLSKLSFMYKNYKEKMTKSKMS